MVDATEAARVPAALEFDEVGIASARYGQFVLRSSYQPLFRHGSGHFTPFAVEALISPHIGAQSLPATRLFETVVPEDKVFVEGLCRRLHLENFRYLCGQGLDLFLNFDPGSNAGPEQAVAEIRQLTQRFDDLGCQSSRLICEITEAEAPDDYLLLRVADELRRRCIRMAIDDFGTGCSGRERLDLLRPQIVKLDGGWFRRLVGRASPLRAPAFVAALHNRGCEVLVEGIETPDLLRAAVNSGADYFQGYLLARPVLAGMAYAALPIDGDALMAA